MKHCYGWLRIIVLVTFLSLVSGLQPVTADNLSPQNTILVTTGADEYDQYNALTGCALREAIEAANRDIPFGGCTAGSVVDTIIFNSGITTFQLSIGGSLNNDNTAGDLNIKTDMTIQGNGQQATIIDGSYQATTRSRIIDVNDGQEYAGISVTIRDLSIINGNSQSSGGGAVYNAENLTLEDVTITDSLSKFVGGAIYSYPLPSDSQSLTLRHCIISRNTGTHGGGGIFNSKAMTVEDSYFSNNYASSPSDGRGGAIFMVIGGSLSISRTVFDDNQAGVSGGNLYLASNTGPYLIEDSVITNGSAANGHGGNIYASYDTYISPVDLTIRNTEISAGAAYTGNGGGIYSDLNLTLENVTLSGNNANYGGGLFTASTHSSVSINNSTVARNGQTVAGAGDGIYYATLGAVSFMNSIFANNGYSGDASGHGTDCGGSSPAGPPSLGYNLDRGDSCLAGDWQESDMDHTDPLMGGLQHNYGISRTHALLTGSPAIDAGNNATCMSTDQRGWYRPVDGDNNGTATCDIGAYEFGHLLGFLPLVTKP